MYLSNASKVLRKIMEANLQKISPDELSLFLLTDDLYLADLGFLQQGYYTDCDPGKKFVINLPVHFNKYVSNHLRLDAQHFKRIEWIERNSFDLIRAIESPEFIEKMTRAGKDGHYSLTNIVTVSNFVKKGWEYMAVAISLSNGDSVFHQITTIHQLSYRNLFSVDGNLRKKTVSSLFFIP